MSKVHERVALWPGFENLLVQRPDELLISSRGPFLPALSSWSMAMESPLRSTLYGTLQGVAVLADSSHACCSCVPLHHFS